MIPLMSNSPYHFSFTGASFIFVSKANDYTRSEASGFARSIKERLYSVFRFSLLCDEASRTSFASDARPIFGSDIPVPIPSSPLLAIYDGLIDHPEKMN
jgi:hypothetical protein